VSPTPGHRPGVSRPDAMLPRLTPADGPGFLDL